MVTVLERKTIMTMGMGIRGVSFGVQRDSGLVLTLFCVGSFA